MRLVSNEVHAHVKKIDCREADLFSRHLSEASVSSVQTAVSGEWAADMLRGPVQGALDPCTL